MAYKKQNFESGAILFAEQLNHIEDGIVDLENKVNDIPTEPPEDGEDGYSPTVTVSKSGKVTTIKITDKDGTKTATINDGTDGKTPVKGTDYFDGKDGYTPVKDVDYFDGKDGYTPQKGKDYFDGKDGKDYVLTTSDKTEIAEMVEGATIVQAPKYVNSVNEMTDTDRPYVLISTGHIWANAETTVETEGTVTDNITATTDNPYVDGSRLGSSGDAMNNDAGGYHITPLIDLTKAEYQGKTIQIHLEGAQYASTGAYAAYIQCRAYGTNKAVLMQRPYTVDVPIGGSGLVEVTNGTISVEYKSATSAVITIDVPPTYGSSKVAIGYLRFCGKGSIANSKIYITYTDTITTTGVQWFDTGTSYAPTLTAEDKAEIAEDVAEMIDTQLLSIIGDGSVTV